MALENLAVYQQKISLKGRIEMAAEEKC